MEARNYSDSKGRRHQLFTVIYFSLLGKTSRHVKYISSRDEGYELTYDFSAFDRIVGRFYYLIKEKKIILSRFFLILILF